jgi:hypothetical protein
VCSFSGSAVKEIRCAESRWAMDAMTGYEPEMKIITETIRCVEVETSRNPEKYSILACSIIKSLIPDPSDIIRHHQTRFLWVQRWNMLKEAKKWILENDDAGPSGLVWVQKKDCQGQGQGFITSVVKWWERMSHLTPDHVGGYLLFTWRTCVPWSLRDHFGSWKRLRMLMMWTDGPGCSFSLPSFDRFVWSWPRCRNLC